MPVQRPKFHMAAVIVLADHRLRLFISPALERHRSGEMAVVPDEKKPVTRHRLPPARRVLRVQPSVKKVDRITPILSISPIVGQAVR